MDVYLTKECLCISIVYDRYSFLINTNMNVSKLLLKAICVLSIVFVLTNCADKNYPVSLQSHSSQQISYNPYLTYGTLQDTDANVYRTIQIGTQLWMAENLRTTHYRNGEFIPYVTDNVVWSVLRTGGQTTYNNSLDPDTIAKFGRLYNFYAVEDYRYLAPKGWHVSSDLDWVKLIAFISSHLGNSPSVGKSLAGSTDWSLVTDKDILSDFLAIGADLSFNNSSGFSAMPAGYRADFGKFNSMSRYGDWWTSTQEDAGTAWSRYMSFYFNAVYWSRDNLNYGFAVRCVKDE
jgi:uncharacterized protein (TIGR02145 family)